VTQAIIDIGDAPNDGTGDPLQTAFTKANANFTELYAAGGGTATPPQGRLTLQMLTPVMTTTQAGKIIIYYTPYVGNQVPIYDGANMVMTTFAELVVAIADSIKSPAAIGASKVNDWFIWNDAGTIRVGHGPDWTSDTARSVGTALTMVNGILLNNASITNGPAASRGTYVGTTRSNASSQLDWIFGATAANGTAGFFGVWNAYNRVDVATRVGDTTDSWTYTTLTWRAANNSATMRVSYVIGLSEDAVKANYNALAFGNQNSFAGIGVDAITAFSGTSGQGNTAGSTVSLQAFYNGYPGIGFHFVSAIEASNGASSTFLGDNANSLFVQTGLLFELRM